MEYVLTIGILLCIYVILVLSANLTVGMANLLTMCQAAFYGIGAYVGTIFLMHFHLPFLLVALSVMLMTGVTSLVVSLVSVKLKGDYFILGTLGFQMVAYTLLRNWKGPIGFLDVPKIRLLGLLDMSNIYVEFLFTLLVTLLVIWFFHKIQKSPFGCILRAIREDEISAQSLGYNTTRLKVRSFFLSAAFAGLAGLLLASFQGLVKPDNFSLDYSIAILAALFIGGVGNRVWGPILGAAVVVVLPELLRFLGLPEAEAAYLHQIIYGVALVVLMFLRPQGLLGDVKLK